MKFLVVLSLLAMGSAQAPCDGATSCVNTARYGNNQRRLLDSMDYNKLLPIESDNTGGVWQQINENNDNTRWRDGGQACQQIVSVCSRNDASQENWIITQPILLPISVTSIVVEMDSMQEPMSQCPPADVLCIESLSLYVWETTTRSESSAADTGNYRYVADISSGKGVKVEVSLQRKLGMMYLGIRDNGTCVSVSRLLVYYRVCEGVSEGLVTVEETVVYDSDGKNIVEGQCVENSVSITESPPLLECLESGQWKMVTSGTSYCSCKPGYEENTINGSTVCTECPVGYYSEAIGSSCTPCPGYSNSTQPGMTSCPCNLGYYRPQDSPSYNIPCIKVRKSESAAMDTGEIVGVIFAVFIAIILMVILFILGFLTRKYTETRKKYSPYDSIRHYEMIDAKVGNGTFSSSTNNVSTSSPPLPADRSSRELTKRSNAELFPMPEYAVLEPSINNRESREICDNTKNKSIIGPTSPPSLPENRSSRELADKVSTVEIREYAVLEAPTDKMKDRESNNNSTGNHNNSIIEPKSTTGSGVAVYAVLEGPTPACHDNTTIQTNSPRIIIQDGAGGKTEIN